MGGLVPRGPKDHCMRPCIASDWPAIKHRGAGKPCLPVGLIADKVRGVEVSPREQEGHRSRSWWQTRSYSAFVAIPTESIWNGFQRTVLSKIKICQHLHTLQCCFICETQKETCFFIYKKELIKHHRSSLIQCKNLWNNVSCGGQNNYGSNIVGFMVKMFFISITYSFLVTLYIKVQINY